MSRSSFRGAALAALLFAAACGHPTNTSPLEPAPSAAAEEATSPALSPEQVVARVMVLYPERLADGVTHDERLANMAFLRDRVIEVGICGGLNLAWNQKTNGLRSIDAINWRHGDDDVNDVVDLALDYDNPNRRLELHWHITEGPAGWDPYPQPSCTN